MISLLPTTERVIVEKRYKHRIVVVYLVGLLILLAVFTLLLVPSRLMFAIKKQSAEAALEVAKEQPTSYEARRLEEDVKRVNSQIARLQVSTKDAPVVVSELLGWVLSYKEGLDIELKYVEYQQGNMLSLRGVAGDRRSMLAFIQQLEQDGAFIEVDSPIANLIDDENIDFIVAAKFKGSSN